MGGGSRPRIPSIEEVMAKEEEWTIYSGSQNLAAALNDPACREYDLFTKTWGSYFAPNTALPASNLPDIQLGDFLRYLKETSAVSTYIAWGIFFMSISKHWNCIASFPGFQESLKPCMQVLVEVYILRKLLNFTGGTSSAVGWPGDEAMVEYC